MTLGHAAYFNKIKWLLKERRKTVGAWLHTTSSVAAEIFGRAGFDFVVVDLDNGMGTIPSLVQQLQAVSRYDVATFARPPRSGACAIRNILDAGVDGVLVPGVQSAHEAEQAVRSCKYPLEGMRGIGAASRASGYGIGARGYLENANEQVVVLAEIAAATGADRIREIAAVMDLDGIYIEPMDLAASLGHLGNPSHPEVRAAVAKIERAALEAGKFLGTAAGDPKETQALYEEGYTFVTAMSDSGSLAAMAMDQVSRFHRRFPAR